MNNLPAHSPLGASGASRWMACQGSVSLSTGVKNEESVYASEGTTAHALAEVCLTRNTDAWEYIGIDYKDFSGCEVTNEMANAVQEYLDGVRIQHPERDQSNSFIERGFHCPSIHPMFYGRSDFTYIDHQEKSLHVWDYKHGVGIVVEADNNPQGMYYALGMIEDLGLQYVIDRVVIHIAQPRAFHRNGPLREWEISAEDLYLWRDEVLIPAMLKAETCDDTASGEHCRFCPANGRACPQLLKDFNEMEELMVKAEKVGVGELSDAQIGRFLSLFDVAKLVANKAGKIAFERLQSGKIIPGRKLAHARSNRVWKDGAEGHIRDKFGKHAFTDPKLKSPAQIEELPEGSAITAEYAYKPETKLTVVAQKDSRAAVSRDTKSLFTDQTKKEKE